MLDVHHVDHVTVHRVGHVTVHHVDHVMHCRTEPGPTYTVA